jgi:hypothetical protein
MPKRFGTRHHIIREGESMLIELVTPLMLATAPVTIDAVAPRYSHETQTAVEQVGQFRTSTTTFNGTQTFDWNGKPKDSDSDQDTD